MNPSILILSLLGLLSLTKLTFAVLRCIYAFFLRPASDLRSHYGSWAIVTGSTDGIGKAMAFELARRNLNLLLIGRNPEKLDTVSAAIASQFQKVEIKKVVIDLSEELILGDGIEKLKKEIGGLEVGILVNNAGIVNKYAMLFHEGDVEKWMGMVRVNLTALTEITKAVVPVMLTRRRGAIVNVGSASAVAIPSFPLYAVYAATKAYVDQFSKSLNVEYKSSGIDVQCHVPAYVDTKLASKVKASKFQSFFVASVDVYARVAVSAIGYEAQCMPYFPHFLQYFFMRVMPDFIIDHVLLHLNMKFRANTKQRKVK